ncbi:GIY-YIG nuclease family protein [Flagellimonas aequoris]
MGKYYVYILTNQYKTVLYTGVTNNLKRRLVEHDENIRLIKTTNPDFEFLEDNFLF